MINKVSRNEMRKIRHERVRSKIFGTPAVPRLCVYRSSKNISAQIIDDENGITLASASSLTLKLKNGGNKEAATKVGEAIAEACKKEGITKVVFDRGGYLYHGRVEALAEAARSKGLEF
ncbi:MAG: 50S ribosomal protein L18 [Bacilli bacterium]|nr:50S ribosomal protein L18 [Bacilli bacterium]